MYLLDTDVISALRKPGRFPDVTAALTKLGADNLYISVISIGEIERGITLQKQRNPDFSVDLRSWWTTLRLSFGERVLPFGIDEAILWGQLAARTGHTGSDLQIAATAMMRGATIVTRNVRHFAPTGVDILNPF